jgi:aminoglycoside/choline kinase family phosphotransferase
MLAHGGGRGGAYARATDVLVTIHAAPGHGLLPDLPTYEGEALIDGAMLVTEWYLPEATGRATTSGQTESYRTAWRACLQALPPGASCLMLRDYHKDNLLWLPQRPGVRACGLLDFQDAQTRPSFLRPGCRWSRMRGATTDRDPCRLPRPLHHPGRARPEGLSAPASP